MKNRSLTIIILLFVLGATTLSCLAQARSCNLQLKVYEFRDTGDSEQFPVSDSKIRVTGAETEKPLKVVKIDNFPIVSNINEGEYKVTASRPGFQNTSKTISVNCSLTNIANEVSEIIFLWKGDSGKTINILGSAIGGSRNDEQNSAAGETLNGSAVSLGRPVYPPAARAVRASGTVQVQVLINELDYIVSAEAVSGHPLLRSAAVEAAKSTKFKMTLLEGKPVKVSGIITYNFVP